MTPIFLSHTTLDAVGILEDALLTDAMGRDRLRALLDRAMAEGRPCSALGLAVAGVGAAGCRGFRQA